MVSGKIKKNWKILHGKKGGKVFSFFKFNRQDN